MYIPEGEKVSGYVYSLRYNTRMWQTDRWTDTAWWHRLH